MLTVIDILLVSEKLQVFYLGNSLAVQLFFVAVILMLLYSFLITKR